MTERVNLQSLYSAADATTAELDRMFEPDRLRRINLLRSLESVVARLEFGSSSELEASSPGEVGRADRPRSQATERPEPPPFLPLPRRTTPGGDWGPAMKAKLYAEALTKQGW